MNLTTQWMHSDWMKTLGWTFVHSLWQIALIGLLLYVILRLIPGRSAHIRYTISTLALWTVVIVSLCTFIIMLPDTRMIQELSGNVIFLKTTEHPNLAEKISAWIELRMPMMLTIWIGGVLLLMLRLAISLAWVRQLRSAAIPDSNLQLTLNQIIKRLRLRVNPTASQSELVSSPVTIGYVKPFILFPIGIINHLSPNEVEAILTHELAHIVRRDYLSNLIQSFIETLFYYHPVTWWISRMVRTERENRADDLAVSWCGDHLGYAKALMTVQEMQVKATPGLSIGFASQKGAMLARIQRILHLPYKNHNQMEKTVLLSLCSLCFMAFTLTSHTPKSDGVDKMPVASNTTITVIDEKVDSIPSKGIYRIHKKTDDQDISIEVEDGNIMELTIDGKEIEPSEFEAYDEIISGLFGSVETPGTMHGFNFTMPSMPTIPEVPMVPDMAPFTDFMEGFEFTMPPIPPMPDINMEELLGGYNYNYSGDGSNMHIWNGTGIGNFEIFGDSLPHGMGSNMIIIINGDTTIHHIPNMDYAFDLNGYMKDKDQWKEHEKQWKEELKSQAEQWRGQSEQWREQQQDWREGQEDRREHLRDQSEERRREQELLREELRGHKQGAEDHHAIERELRMIAPMEPFMYDNMTPRLSLSDQLVRDGLVEQGDEVEVLLTPDKLKIDGQKMPDAIHQKYLNIYERQQGVELSGNSRVAFTTKSKQRM